MDRKMVLIFLFLSFQLIVSAKPDGETEAKKNQKGVLRNWYVEAGGVYSSFQDIKFSDVRYSGFGGALKFGYKRFKADSHFWEAALNFQYSKENAATHDLGGTSVLYPNIYFKYLKILNDNFAVGARIDLLDIELRVIPELQNNGTYYIASNNIYGSVLYKRPINSNWNFSASADLAIFGIKKESTSFAMNYNQKQIEDRKVDYQDEFMAEPFPYKFWEFSHIANFLNIKTEFTFHYKKRISAGYNWEMKHWATVKSYPTTVGAHSIVFRYNFAQKQK